MQILSQDQRAALLKSLETASDDILLTAVSEMRNYRLRVQGDFDTLKNYIGMTPINEAAKPKYLPVLDTIVAPASVAISVAAETNLTLPNIDPPKPNITPPGEAAYKVGGDTKEKILMYCKVPKTLIEINKFLGRGKGMQGATESLLKRLWDLQQIQYDGANYIVVS